MIGVQNNDSAPPHKGTLAQNVNGQSNKPAPFLPTNDMNSRQMSGLMPEEQKYVFD